MRRWLACLIIAVTLCAETQKVVAVTASGARDAVLRDSYVDISAINGIAIVLNCGARVGVTAGVGSFDRSATQLCGATPVGFNDAGVAGNEHRILFRQRDCGPPNVGAPAVLSRQNVCNFARDQCWVQTVTELPMDPRVTTIAHESSTDGGASWLYDGATCNYLTERPQVTPWVARQEVERLVPHPRVGVAPPGGRTLVNVQTVLWADTPADRSLGTVTLLGRFRVALRIQIEHVEWVFGDGHTDSTNTPGTPYRPGEHCLTVTCRGHYGHIYKATGAMIVTAQVSWSGRYAVNGGAWQEVPGTVTGPRAAMAIQVEEARGVLVQDPGQG